MPTHKRNGIGNDGAKSIVNSLKRFSSLHTLRNSIGDDGAKSIAEGLKHCSSLNTES